MSTSRQRTIECPGCGSLLEVEPKHEGKVIECPACHTSVRVPRARHHVESTALTEKHILVEIRDEIRRTNKLLFPIYVVFIINLICTALATLMAFIAFLR